MLVPCLGHHALVHRHSPVERFTAASVLPGLEYLGMIPSCRYEAHLLSLISIWGYTVECPCSDDSINAHHASSRPGSHLEEEGEQRDITRLTTNGNYRRDG